MFKNILVATDGSNHANKAVDLASDMAAKNSAALTVLSVIESGALTEGARRLAREKGVYMNPCWIFPISPPSCPKVGPSCPM